VTHPQVSPVTNPDMNENAMNEARHFPPAEIPPLDGELVLDTDVRAAAGDDFGHVIARLPLAVLRPGSVQDIAVVVRWATDNGWKVAARGKGHSTFCRSRACGPPSCGRGSTLNGDRRWRSQPPAR
jgi:hypothetical protein